MRNAVVSNVLGVIGAGVGGIIGYYLFFWITTQGFYGLMIPGAFMGLGCSLLARHRSVPRGIAVAVAAVVLGVYIEWRFRPFRADDSLGYFLKHLSSLTPTTQVMIAFGAVFGFWMGKDSGGRLGRTGLGSGREAE